MAMDENRKDCDVVHGDVFLVLFLLPIQLLRQTT